MLRNAVITRKNPPFCRIFSLTKNEKRRILKMTKDYQNLKVEFTGKNLTPFGGFKVFIEFVKKLKVKEILKEEVSLNRRENKYSLTQMLLSIIYALVLELFRLSDMILLRLDSTFCRLVNFTEFPSLSTISRFLNTFTFHLAQKVQEASVRLLKSFREDFRKISSITLDCDSHTRTVYGNQEGATKGYNHKKPGRKCFQPLFCFIGETRDFLLGKFKGGKKFDSLEAIEFFKECLSHLPKHFESISFRGDSGFYSENFLQFLESSSIEYAIAVVKNEPIQFMLSGVRYYPIGGNYEAGEFWYQGFKAKLPRRMVVIREKIQEDESSAKRILKFIEVNKYSYQVIVTNREGNSPEEIWKWYNGRANVENMIKEGVFGYGLDVNVVRSFGGNTAHFFLVMFAYNLMNWFKEVALGQVKTKHMVKWIRQKILFIPGKMVKVAKGLVLKLSSIWSWKKEYEKAENKIKEWQISFA